MIKCPNCGGEVDYKPGEKKVVCQYCNTKFDPETELKVKVKVAKENKPLVEKEEKEEKNKDKKENDTYEGKTYSCSQCGATLMTFDETAITFCSYCGSQAMIEEKMIKQNNPDFIIPFEKTKEECIAAYKNKINRAIFAPKYMKEADIVEKFRGIYMPYGIYKVGYNGVTTNKGSRYSHRTGDFVYYDDYKITADVNTTYDGISFDLVSKFYDKFSNSIPYNYKLRKDFNPNYLTGFYADTKDVDESIYDAEACNVARGDANSRLKRVKGFSQYGCSNPQVPLEPIDKKVGMFPVYFLAIRDKSKENVHYAVINGQTGKVALDLPIDFKKYILGSLILALVVFLLIDGLIVLKPKQVAIFSIIAGIISLIISSTQISSIKNKELHTDDKGYMSKQDKKKQKKTGTFKYLYKEIISIIIPIVALIMNFINDEYYYGAAIISLVLVVISFKDLVKEHNILSSNKLPQLEKRGGDESE